MSVSENPQLETERKADTNDVPEELEELEELIESVVDRRLEEFLKAFSEASRQVRADTWTSLLEGLTERI